MSLGNKNLFDNEPIIKNAARYASRKHRETNHMYDDVYPYKLHLKMVYKYAIKYLYLILFNYSESEIINALAAAWAHDVIEDTRETYNDVKAATNKGIADIVYALTNHKGKTRAQRAGKAYYNDIKEHPLADYIKICDRLANIKYSSTTQSHMLEVYRKEHEHFKNMLYKSEYEEMFKEMDELLKPIPDTEIYYARKAANRHKTFKGYATLFNLMLFITTLLALFLYIRA